MEAMLRRGLAALGLPEEGAPAMARYGRLLMEWNERMNLTALRTEEEIARLHFFDSCAVLTLFDCRNSAMVDVGSGAGFPGLPMGIAEPSIRLTLLDAQRKRVEFLREACREAGLPAVECVQGRAEEYGRTHRERYDIAVSRAVAALPVLVELCLPLVRVGGAFLAMKSVNSGQELAESKRAVSRLGGRVERTVDYTIPETAVTHRLLVIRKIHPTPEGYPRAYAKIKKAPL